jgi:hypothetical protein
MSRIAVSEWTSIVGSAQVPVSATEVWWTVVGNFDSSGGVPIVGAVGRIAYVTITYDAAGVYTIGLNSGTDAVADVVADGLADEAAVLDHLASDLTGLYGGITFTRVAVGGTDTLVMSAGASKFTIQADCTGGSATLDIDASAESVEQVSIGAIQVIDGTSTAWVMAASQSGSLTGGRIDLVPGLVSILVPVTPDTSSPPDTAANAATVTLKSYPWVRFYREVPSR